MIYVTHDQVEAPIRIVVMRDGQIVGRAAGCITTSPAIPSSPALSAPRR
ncbi:hypothetical protein LNP25_28145 [Klebsiella variicola subsp. variicola]|nr:hypothetical protein [Klebsiella variicola subsp. variicola]